MGFGNLEWFYVCGCELIGVALAYGCGLIDLVVGCCGLCRVLVGCEIFLWCAMVDRFGDWLWVCCCLDGGIEWMVAGGCQEGWVVCFYLEKRETHKEREKDVS